ncbi:hypothetical protein pipiens_012474 [Culex pipiens pipiens]|uniref:Uncharacterized protein n=1 Tax=Culex pipiens pipiens TaxID=38569 RepID=A0ABD1D548_CULPP
MTGFDKVTERFVPNNQCDVASVEFAKAQRLTNGTVEPLSFAVPRIKSELFLEDLFPPIKVLWEPTFTASNKPAVRISLQPGGMNTCKRSNNPKKCLPVMTPKPGKMSDSTNINQLIGQKTQFNKSWVSDLVRSGAEGPDFAADVLLMDYHRSRFYNLVDIAGMAFHPVMTSLSSSVTLFPIQRITLILRSLATETVIGFSGFTAVVVLTK